MTWKNSPPIRLLASLRLAVAVLASLILALAAGSFVEARVGSAAAKALVYRSFWFHILLGALFLNVLASLLVRIPLRPRQYGFAATHAGILTILVGAVLTAALGTEGGIALSEGSTGNEMLREFGGRVRLPFAISLQRFDLELDPASTQTAGYRSQLALLDERGRLLETASVSMNKPLRYEGYAIYQSGYERLSGRPARSFLVVARDPGRFLKYLGALITVLGIAGHFWLNRHNGKVPHA